MEEKLNQILENQALIMAHLGVRKRSRTMSVYNGGEKTMSVYNGGENVPEDKIEK